MTEWHPKMTRELLPGRSVHDWDRILRTLTRIGLPGWLVCLVLTGGGLVLGQLDGVRYEPWVWWVVWVVGLPALLSGSVWILGTRLVGLSMTRRSEAERAAGYTTSPYAPNFMIRAPEIDHVDGESGRIVRLATEPWLTEPEYETRLLAIRDAAGRDPRSGS